MHFEPCIDPKITWFLHFAMYLHNFSYDIQPYPQWIFTPFLSYLPYPQWIFSPFHPNHSGYSHLLTLLGG